MGRTSDARQRLLDAVMELIWAGSYGSTSVEDICARADVGKGSFYHFFPSKTALADAGIAAAWEARREEMDRMFSPLEPPLERLRRWADATVAKQKELHATCGHVLGCPLQSLGAEISTREEPLRRRIESIFAQYHRYLESAIADAAREGTIQCADPAARSRMALAFCEGLLTRARIANDTAPLEELTDGLLAIVKTVTP